MLPAGIGAQAHKTFLLFQRDMSHPSSRLVRIEGYPYGWSGPISRAHRRAFHTEEALEMRERIYVHRVTGAHEDVYGKS